MTAPSASARAVMAFANSVDLEEGTDELASPAAFCQWLLDSRLVPARCAVTAHEHAQGLRLRAGIREILGPDGPRPHVLSEADSALRDLPLLVSTSSLLRPDPDALLPDPGLPAVPRALSALAASLATVLITGEVTRVKRCPAADCGWVFWDSSKNRSRRWCSMDDCGARSKMRRYRAKAGR